MGYVHHSDDITSLSRSGKVHWSLSLWFVSCNHGNSYYMGNNNVRTHNELLQHTRYSVIYRDMTMLRSNILSLQHQMPNHAVTIVLHNVYTSIRISHYTSITNNSLTLISFHPIANYQPIQELLQQTKYITTKHKQSTTRVHRTYTCTDRPTCSGRAHNRPLQVYTSCVTLGCLGNQTGTAGRGTPTLTRYVVTSRYYEETTHRNEGHTLMSCMCVRMIRHCHCIHGNSPRAA